MRGMKGWDEHVLVKLSSVKVDISTAVTIEAALALESC